MKFVRLLPWLAVGPVVIAGALACLNIARLVAVPYEINYGEGLVVWQAQHVTNLAQAYHPIDAYPFVVFMYPPLYPALMHAAGAVVGDLALAGRLVTSGALLGLMATVAALTRALIPDSVPRVARLGSALAAAAIVPVLGPVRDIAPNARVDVLALALTLGGVLLFLGSRRQGWRAYAAAACFVAAFYTKQSMVAAPLACALVLAARDWRTAVRFAVVGLVMAVVPWIVFEQRTGGQFGLHLFTYTRNTFSVSQFASMLAANLWHAWPVLLLAALTVHQVVTASSAPSDVATEWKTRAVALYAILAGLVTISAGKTGSGIYYFMEWNVACVVLAGAFLARALGACLAGPVTWRPAIAVLLVSMFAAGQTPVLANSALQITDGARRLEASRRQEFSEALALVRRTQGPVIAHDMLLLVDAGKDVSFEPFIMYELARTGVWDPAPFVAQLRRGDYRAFIAESDPGADPRIPAPIRDALVSQFALDTTIGKYRVYTFAAPDVRSSR